MRRRGAFFVVALVLVTAMVVGVLADRWVRAHVDVRQRAMWHLQAGDRATAERLLWQSMHDRPPTPTLVLVFLDNHRALSLPSMGEEEEGESENTHDFSMHRVMPRGLSDAEIERFLTSDDMPHDARLVASFRIALMEDVPPDDADLEEIVRRAHDRPPMQWANHLLALDAALAGDERRAIDLFVREGTAYPSASRDIDVALARLEDARDWDAIAADLADPRVAAAADPWFVLRSSLHAHRILAAARASVAASYQRPRNVGPMVLAAFAALAWLLFCFVLGRARERPFFRPIVYCAALLLGVASIAPTTFLIGVQETYLHLVPNGTPGRDLVFFVLGVGFREELSKLLCFAPLLLVLRRRGTALDVVVCGAVVGLGFALVENLQYFERGSLETALTRFLTANFLHMAMTAITAHALWDVLRAKEDKSFDASRTVLLVVLLHGLYDFFLSSHVADRASLVSMAVFFLLTRWFVRHVVDATPPGTRRAPVATVFALGAALVAATSFVYGCIVAGPTTAALAMLEGLVGVAVMLFIFVRELRALT